METAPVGMSASAVDAGYARKAVVASVFPTTGQAVSNPGGSSDYTLWCQPAAALAALTVNLPTDAASQIGDIARIGSSKTITILTLAGPASILDSVGTLSANQIVSYKKLAADTWALI